MIKQFTNEEISNQLKKVAAALTLSDENRFRVIAYEKAAESIEKSATEVQSLWKEKKLNEITGIGPSIAQHLDELFKTGKVRHFEKILEDLPEAVFPLTFVPGIGVKRAYALVTELHLKSAGTVIDDLMRAAKEGKIARLDGFGEKSQQDIIEGLKRFKQGQIKEKRIPLAFAFEIAQDVIAYLKQNKHVKSAVPLGSLRRMVSSVGDVDIAVATEKPDDVVRWFIKYPSTEDLIEKGPTGASILLSNGRQIDLRVQSPQSFGAMIQYFTGSKQHNIRLREYSLKKGMSLSEYGIKPVRKSQISNLTLKNLSANFSVQNFNSKHNVYEFPSEESFYEALGVPWIPPEMREDRGEIEAALKGSLPDLVQLEDIRGEFHVHSNYPIEPSHDLGSSTIMELQQATKVLGYEYLGISDHNPSLSKHSKNKIINILKRRKQYIEHINQKTKSVRAHLFTMLEIDILPSGERAIPDDAFDFLDAGIVSVHSNFTLPKEEMTQRVLKGLSHPKVKILGHPTGRLIEKRDGYELDWEKVFTYCRENNKALEINAYPDRLDLPDNLVFEAVKRGVRLVIDTDSHSKEQLIHMRYGVAVSNRGWATKNDIINTMTLDKVKNWINNQ